MTEVVTLQVRRNLGELSNALGLKWVGRFVVDDVRIEERRHYAATKGADYPKVHMIIEIDMRRTLILLSIADRS